MTAAESTYYDKSYSNPESAALLPASESPLAPLYREVRMWVPSSAVVHDLGCGTGQLGEVLFESGEIAGYHGIDFSETAIDEARKRLADYVGERVPHWRLDHADLRFWEPPEDLHNVVFVILETLEHLDDDLGLLRKVQPGRRIIFSVPSFDSATHLRWFTNIGDVWGRYQPLLTIHRWSMIEVGSAGGTIHLLDTRRRGDAW